MSASGDLRISGPRSIVIPAAAMEWQFARSSGPGGQHVNRTSSKAILRFDAVHCDALPDDVRRRLVAAIRPRLTKDGAILIVSQRHRDRPRNMADCRTKLESLVHRATIPPPVRRKTKKPRSAVADRLDAKKRRGRTKQLRRQPAD